MPKTCHKVGTKAYQETPQKQGLLIGLTKPYQPCKQAKQRAHRATPISPTTGITRGGDRVGTPGHT